MTAADVEHSETPASRKGSFRLRVPGFTNPPSPHGTPSIPPDELNARRDEISGAALPLVSAALGIMLLLSSFFRIQPADSAPGMAGAGVCGVVGIALVIVAIVTSRRPRTGSTAAAALAVLLVTTIALCLAMLASGTLAQTAYIQLLVVVAGPVMLRPGWFAITLVAIWSLWLGSVAALSGTTDPSGWLLAMLAATLVSVVLHTMRTDSLRALGNALLAAEAAAVRDPLTGLLNRRGLDVVGAEVLALAKRSREPLSCTFVDIDGLKQVNDRHGHDAGDQVITAVSEALLGVFREADVVARWGGDEFVIIGLGAGPRVEDVERRLAERLAYGYGDDGVSLSAGRVVHMPWQDEGLLDLTERADQEMYRRRRLRRMQEHDSETG
ncbi:MAG: diguanylate cyclase [Candidatus Nanopelagicales bacterium]